MSRKYTILALFVAVALSLAHSDDPENGKTGAPGEGLCSDCHSNSATQQGTIVLTGLPATIEPNGVYVLTITNTKTMGDATSKAGFQITILNSLNQKAGNMVGPSANSAIESQNNRQYWEHMNAPNYPANNMFSWTVTWTAPASPPNTTITAYCVGNIANGNGMSSGDRIVTSTSTGTLNGGANPLTASITNSINELCFGGANGSATVTATGGVTPYSYNWSNGGTTATITNLSAGTYTVTVTDTQPTTATASVTITQPTNLVFTAPTITNVTCNGGNNGSITAHASGGTVPYGYNWSNGGSGATISNLTAANYIVTVTDDNGCTKMTTYTVTQPTAMAINLISLINESCAGQQDGGIIITTSGGVPPLFSEWSNGSVGNSISDLAPGSYSVTVTDNNNCTKTTSYTINAGGTVAVDLINIINVNCPGGNNGSVTVLASGGMAPYTYAWSNGASGATASNLAAGNYLVTTTDSKGCQTVKFYTVTQPAAFNLSIAQAQSNLCFGDANVDLTATVSGGTAPYTSLWSNTVVGLSNPNLGAGTYTITVTDDHGCTATASSVVTQPTLLGLTVTTTDETGVGTNNGTATASPSGGTGTYTYLWSNGGTTNIITSLAPGTYSVTVTDANGCTAQGSGQVDAFGCSIDVMLGVDFTICAEDTFLLMPFVTGESGSINYLWSTGDTTSTIQVSSGGEYCVTVQDQAGCQDADCIVVTEIIFPAFNCIVANESAPGQNDGAITCDTIPNVISYLWSNGATTPSITGLTPGQYCLTVTDINGCSASDCFNVQPGNCNLSITSIITDVVCAGDTTGSIAVSVENATPPVTYAWSNGKTTSTIDHLSADAYSVTINDAAGCIENRNYTVSESAAIQIAVDTIISISDFSPGIVLITTTGGVSPYNYLWTAPGGGTNTNEDQVALSETGYYSVLATDASGCTTLLDSIFVGIDVAVKPVPKVTALKVYPVPTKDLLHIDLEGSVKEVIVSGIDGRNVMQTQDLQNNILDVSRLESGLYFLRISDGKQWYVARMVK
jgi:hypothetical protein